MKTIVFSPRASKTFDALSRAVQEVLIEALIDYAVRGRGDLKALSDRRGYRLRVGSYRIIFDEDRTTILALYFGVRETTTYRRN